MKSLLIIALLVGSFGCTKDIPPNLSPDSRIKYQATKVILALDVSRDAAIALADAGIITRPESVRVVEFHKAAITVVYSASPEWKITVLKALDELKGVLSVTAQNQLGHYLDLAKVLIQEVTN